MTNTHLRLQIVDLLRGCAVAMMMVFHFCFLMSEFNLAFSDFLSNPFWRNFRLLIVTSFIGIVGVSLAIAWLQSMNWRRFMYRQIQLLIYAAIVSLSTYWFEPKRVVIFGILQFIFVASLLGLFFVRLKWSNLFIGIMLIGIALWQVVPSINASYWFWLGFASKKPFTYDFVPLLPWFGVLLIGIFIGQLLIRHPALAMVRSYQADHKLSKFLMFMGRHSLNLYMLHVPVFFGLLMLLVNW